MKRLLVLVSVFLLGLSALSADEYVVGSVDCYEVEYSFDSKLVLKYDDSKDVYYLVQDSLYRTKWFTLSPENLEKLREIVKKAQEWADIARKNSATVTKDIPDSQIKGECIMKSGNDWYKSYGNLALNFLFVANSDESGTNTFLGLIGDAKESLTNQFIDVEFESIVFVESQIDSLAKVISPESVQAAKEKHEAEKKVEDLFL